jgi:para-nitrobenzyl esterase
MYRLVAILALTSAAIADPIKIDSGQISGTTGVTNPQVHVYRGIPYAAPPTGELRWKPPQPAKPWEGVLKAEQFGARCMQAGGAGAGADGKGGAAKGKGPGGPTTPMSEDCLFLNIWTAAQSPSEKRPVMVWAHPGGYTSGSGQYDGEPLASKGVVLVTINYRLGVFGFFSHPELSKESEHNASGNQGLMDEIQALQWVKKNIANFGGDPNNVTIFGDSAGASMNAGLVGSPKAKGLFGRAISESGAWMGLSMNPMTPLKQAEDSGTRVQQVLAASSLADLRTKSAEDLQAKGRGSGMMIDGWVIPEDLSLTFAQGKQNKVDILIGSNKDEGTFFQGRGPAASPEQAVAQAKQRWADLADQYLKLYPANTAEEAAASSLMRFRDELGWHQRTYAKLQEKTGKKVYIYYFTHEPPSAPGQPSRGATHGAEATYVFNTPGRLWTDADKSLGDQLSSYWTNFAATGDPNGKGLPKWSPYHAKDNNQPMILGEKVDIQPDADRIALYDALYAKQKPR